MKILVHLFCILTVFEAADQFVNATSFASSSKCFLTQNHQSCADIKKHYPSSPSGYYQLVAYCNMEGDCGSEGEGWTRVAHLNMSDSNQICPHGFELYQSGGVRACGRQKVSGAGCQSVTYQAIISYSQVCGKVIGYQYGTPDAVSNRNNPNHDNINSYYVDGVSITHGYPRQHIWTLMAGVSEVSGNEFSCPCSTGSTQNDTLQSFIGNNYFCESGNPNSATNHILYTQDPLWDGKGCSSIEQTCCSSRPGLPWFNNVLNSTTTNYIELRVCADESAEEEDVCLSFYEIYVK